MLGAVIRRARQEKGWSQDQLATAAGVSRRHVSQIETGRANASYDVLARIARALDLSAIAVGKAEPESPFEVPPPDELREKVDDLLTRLQQVRDLVAATTMRAESAPSAQEALPREGRSLDDPRYRELIDQLSVFPAEQRQAWYELLTAPLHDEPSEAPLGSVYRLLVAARHVLDGARVLAEQSSDRALQLTNIAIEMTREVRESSTRFAVNQLAALAWRERAYHLIVIGRELQALDAIDRSAKLYEEASRSRYDLAMVEMVRAGVLTRLQRYAEAADLYRGAGKMFAEFGESRQMLKCDVGVAICLQHMAQDRESLEVWKRCEPEALALGDKDNIGTIYHGIGIAYRNLDQLDEAEHYLRLAAENAVSFGYVLRSLLIEWSIAMLWAARGEIRRGLRRLQELYLELESHAQLQMACLCMLQIVELKLTLGETRGIEETCRDLVERFTAAGKSVAAVSALAYLKEAAQQKKLQPHMVVKVREYLEKSEREPQMLFLAPPE